MKRLLILFLCCFIKLINAAAPYAIETAPLKAEVKAQEFISREKALAAAPALVKYDTKVGNNTGETIEIEVVVGGIVASPTCPTTKRTIRPGASDSVTGTCCLRELRVKVTSGQLNGQSQLVEGDITHVSGSTRMSCKSNVFIATIQNNRLVVERLK